MSGILLPLVENALEAHGIVFEAMECDPEFADTAQFCEKYGFSPDQAANTILVAAKTDPVRYGCCMVLATSKLDVNKKVCSLMGVKKASFAPMDAALKLSKMEYGGVTIFGLPEDIMVYVDAEVMKRNQIVMGGGNRSSKVVLNPKELTKLPNLQIIEELARPRD